MTTFIDFYFLAKITKYPDVQLGYFGILAISQNLIKQVLPYAVFNASSENRSFVILAWTGRELLRFLNDASGLFCSFFALNQSFYIH